MDHSSPQTSPDPEIEPRTDSPPGAESDIDEAPSLPSAPRLPRGPEPATEARPVPEPAAARPSMPARREEGDALLELFIAEHHVRCPSCRAPVHDLAGRRCPACRQRLVLRIALERPNLGSYLVGFTAALIAAALNAYLAFHFLLEALRLGLTDDRPAYLFISVTGALTSCTVLVLWIIIGRRFRRRGAIIRWIAAALMLVLPIGSFLALVRVLT